MLWMGSHLLVLNTVRVTRPPYITFVMISMMLMLAYLMKPYTYDLNKYSIFFHTGFIPVQVWHSYRPPYPNDEFRLDPLDTTGEPFDQGFEVGFKWLAKIGSKVLPAGSLVPRLDADFGDFRERGPPRSDAMIFLIMGLGFMVLLAGVRSFGVSNDGRTYFGGVDLFLIAPIIFGSVFFRERKVLPEDPAERLPPELLLDLEVHDEREERITFPFSKFRLVEVHFRHLVSPELL